MPEIVYPITIDYVPDWGAWEVVRELATNALDADPGFTIGLAASGDSFLTDHELCIESQGHLMDHHLLLGVSEKESQNAIGQFGEGMKLAMLTLTRMSLTAEIYSNGYMYRNMPAELAGQQVFKIIWEECEGPENITTVRIPGWEYPIYEERIIRPGDPRVLFTDPFGRMIVEGNGDPQLYVKGVWVQKAQNYGNEFAFSYNIKDPRMNRDRGVVESWEMNREIGKIWASVTDQALLDLFWNAVQDGMGERNCDMPGKDIEDKKAHKRALRRAFGQDVVVETSDFMAREAECYGAKAVSASEFGYHLKTVAKDLVGTDQGHVQDLQGQSKIKKADGDLRDDHQDRLRLARRIANRAGFSGKVEPYILPENITAEYQNGKIRVGIQQLADDRDTLRSVLHEIGHSKGAKDGSKDHLDDALDAAVNVILTYARR